MNKKNIAILIFLIIGVFYRVALTQGGNFLFNMDNGRDMVDVREIVELKKWRLTGPTSAIEGVFNGPAWYYLLSIPYILSGGNPYASIITEIVLWAIGGYFLYKLIAPFGKLPLLTSAALWVAGDYIVLTNLYAFNPNPIILLTPLFIFLLQKYIQTGKLKFAAATFFLGGLFFNFEMNFGFLVLPIIFTSLILTGKIEFFTTKHFWIGLVFFLICLLPQAFFDLRHHFLMSKSILNYLSQGQGSYNFFDRVSNISDSFFSVFSATLENHKNLTLAIIILLIFITLKMMRKEKNHLFLICLSTIVVPFIFYLFVQTTVNAWHLGAEAAAFVILITVLINQLFKINIWGKLVGLVLILSIVFFSLGNIIKFFTVDIHRVNNDPSLFKNEVQAVDYIYRYANGKNFKVYTYLPSVIDYSYQYLIWWYGRKTFGYLPEDYAYSPGKPPYIANKVSFSASSQNLAKRPDSHLVFLLEEPDRNYTRPGWEGTFVKLKSLDKKNVGPYLIDIRQE